MLLLKLLAMSVCAGIAFQDFKERAVYWFLFPLMGIFLAIPFFIEMGTTQYLMAIGLNTLIVSSILLILYLYTKWVAKKQFLDGSFGFGDLLFFYAFALGFPTMTFLLLFCTSILFSLLVFLLLRSRSRQKTVPLAGLMGLFLIGILMASAFPMTPSLYLL